jgi:hypothetical protein
MKYIVHPKYGKPNMFIDLNKIIKLCTEQDASWAEECEKVTNAKLGKIQQFAGHPIKARAILQKLKFSLAKYRAHATDLRGIYVDPMEHHRFPWANTCEEIFYQMV